MKTLTLSVLAAMLIGLLQPLKAQVIMFPYEENFAWQVKQIDEFMERFNNSDYTPIKEYLKQQYDMQEVERADLLRSLFNMEDGHWNNFHVIRFLQQVTREENPPYLNFYDKDWYAALTCRGTYQQQQQDFTLILSIEVNERTGGARWVINSVQADFLPEADSSALLSSIDYSAAASATRSINPASYGTDFMALVDALEDTASFSNYMDWNQVSTTMLSFFDQLAQRKLVFQQVSHITYHFLQVPDWIFQVEDFPRQSTNSGWLISRLIPATEEHKEAYRQKTLYLTQR